MRPRPAALILGALLIVVIGYACEARGHELEPRRAAGWGVHSC